LNVIIFLCVGVRYQHMSNVEHTFNQKCRCYTKSKEICFRH